MNDEMGRPTSLTVIGWILIVLGAWQIANIFLTQGTQTYQDALAASGQDPTVAMILNVVGGLVSVAAGWGALKGVDWTRLVYFGWMVLASVYALIVSPFTVLIIVGLVFPLVILFFLFRPAANRWYGKSYLGRD
ncbi:hypothetical protein WJS89_06100 [Sphingomicrobium sp. XHP0235]|uniref:hypothetical protein n=1 Tax=Sphingomicrobium aquimarinum TaxID=3133971 RepID=UPI0031FF2FCA